jgi:hypothetical protein
MTLEWFAFSFKKGLYKADKNATPQTQVISDFLGLYLLL